MAPNDSSKNQPFGFSEPRQERIYQNLRLLGDGPAAFYRDACKIVDGFTDQLDSCTHLVGHLVREVESALRYVLVPMADSKLAGKEKGAKHRSEILAIAAALSIPETDPIVQTWLELASNDYEYAPNKLAHREALGPPRPFDSDFSEWWNNIQATFDTVLERFRLHYLKSLELVEQRLGKEHPSAADAQFIRQHVPNDPATLTYFFDRCTPDWLPFLRDEGFFRRPTDEQPWPQSRYLARIASTKPSEVSEIVLQISETNNTFVLVDFVGALLAMPVELASKFADTASAWGMNSQDPLLADQLGNLMAHLALHGYGDQALRVAEGLLAVLPARQTESLPRDGSDDSPANSSPPGAIVRPNLWNYEQILKTKVPMLIEVAGLPALRFLCGLLDRSLQLSRSLDEGVAADYSYIWRRAVEDHAQDRDQGLDSLLVGSIRDAAEQIAQKGRGQMLDVVARLDGCGRPIFRRIALYLLARFKNEAKDLISERLTDRALFDGAEYRHEYSTLLGEAFDMLSADQQNIIFSWIEEGPDVTDIENPEEAQRYVRSWRMQRLFWLKGHLSEPWSDKYRKLVEEFGEPTESAKFSAFMQEFIGSRSPISAEELKALSVTNIVQRLKSWEPSPGFMMPSREGLAERLARAVTEDPSRFVADIDSFRGVHPTYVRFLIQALQNVLATGQVDWVRLLPFLRWIVDQGEEFEGKAVKDRLDEDPDWRGARRALAYLLEGGFTQTAAYIPFELREAAWEILALLLRDRDPTPEDEARQIRTHEDASHMSINRTRGIAMHTVVRYALWVGKHLDDPDPITFRKMPEVQAALENGLDEELEPSLTVRSVYGRWFAWIQHLDSKWACEHVALIFPKDDANLAMWTVAWGSYVCLSAAFSDSLQTLIAEYRLAIERLGGALPLETKSRTIEARLAEHLMGFFWHGNLELDGSDGLIGLFWNKAPLELRRKALQAIGRWLHTKEPIDLEILKRLRSLWEWRVQMVSEMQSDPKELSSFSWWFSAGQFDDEWAIDQLEQIQKRGALVEVNFDFMQRLVRIAATMPVRAVRCLDIIVRQQKSLWMLCLGHADEIRSVLSEALKGNADGTAGAKGLINYLASAGFRQFGDLLR